MSRLRIVLADDDLELPKLLEILSARDYQIVGTARVGSLCSILPMS